MKCQSHIALIGREYAIPLLSGIKTVESRFMKTRRAPFGAVHPGDQIYFKISGGPLIGAWRASWVREFTDLSPARITAIVRLYNRHIGAPDGYWNDRLDARYGVLIGLAARVELPTRVFFERQFGNGWITPRVEIAGRSRLRRRAAQKKRAG